MSNLRIAVVLLFLPVIVHPQEKTRIILSDKANVSSAEARQGIGS